VTFTVVARDAQTGDVGVAVQSKFLAVGSVVPHAKAGVGAIGTQALVHIGYGTEGLRLLEAGLSPAEALRSLVTADDLPERRQVAIVGTDGSVAHHTGTGCTGYAGAIEGPGWVVMGNMLTGPEVLDEMADYLGRTDESRLAHRLVACLRAGASRGGDRRGQQSAAVLVCRPRGSYGGHGDRLVDLRIDDSTVPIEDLARILELHDLHFGHPDPDSLLPLEGEIEKQVYRALRQVGRDPGGRAGLWPVLESWAGINNVEERMTTQGMIDPVVLKLLLEQAACTEMSP
jgi:uncharacterized Ntn-hydrolase superfamily protein